MSRPVNSQDSAEDLVWIGNWGEPMAQELASHGLKTIRARHTCAHRVGQLLAIDAEVRGAAEESLTEETVLGGGNE